jgi:hypothetical protein
MKRAIKFDRDDVIPDNGPGTVMGLARLMERLKYWGTSVALFLLKVL